MTDTDETTDATTPLMRALTSLCETARQQGDTAAMEEISDQMRAEQERIAAGLSPAPPDPAWRVDLYEDNAGGLYLVGPDLRLGLTYVVTDGVAGGFEADAVALLDGDTAAWTVPTLPTPLLDLDSLTLIAHYDGAQGVVYVARGADGTHPAAGHNGRRYVGHMEETD